MRKELLILGDITVDIRENNEKDITSINIMNEQCSSTRLKMIEDGDRDEMKLREPFYASTLHPGMKIQYTFRYTDVNNPINETMEQCTGIITKVSNGVNLRSMGRGPKFYRKDAAIGVQQDADVTKGKESTWSIVEIKKSLFNKYEEFRGRLYFDIAQNSKLLQIVLNHEKNYDEEESSPNNL